MAKKKKLETDDGLTFSHTDDFRAGVAPEDRDLQDELYRKTWKDSTIDTFEKTLGINPRPQDNQNLVFDIEVLSPEYKAEKTRLKELLNDKKYKIISWDKNWGQDGSYKIAVTFSENLDYKSPEDILKKLES